jgi:hypothetical protein
MVVSDTNGGGRYNFSNNIPTRYHTMASNGAYIKRIVYLFIAGHVESKGE